MKTSPAIALVVSRFNTDITQALKEGCISHLQASGLNTSDIYIVDVPGAVEIPLTCAHLAKTGRYQAIIALGAVIFGETDHYYYVCDGVTAGCNQVMLQYELPVIMGVLTVQNKAQALDRIGGKAGHKGIEAAMAALEQIQVLNQIERDHA